MFKLLPVICYALCFQGIELHLKALGKSLDFLADMIIKEFLVGNVSSIYCKYRSGLGKMMGFLKYLWLIFQGYITFTMKRKQN